METDCIYHPNVLPDVFQRVLKVLQEEEQPIAWKLSKSLNGHIFLGINHFPAASEKIGVPTKDDASKILTTQRNTSYKPQSASSKRKKKSPSQLKRDRERWDRWRRKKANLEPPKVLEKPFLSDRDAANTVQESSQHATTPIFSDKDTASAVQESSLHVEIQADDNPQGTEHIAAVSATAGEHANIMDMYDSSEHSVEIDSDDDSVSELANFCANCNCQPAGVQLKKCSRCQISQYCSVACQRENWSVHKFACSVVATQRTATKKT